MKFLQLLRPFALCASAMLATSGVGLAMMSPGSQDSTFAMKAAQGGVGEVTLAKLALKNGQGSAVMVFARRMIVDHGKANMKLAAIASSQNIPISKSIDVADAAMEQHLMGLHGSAFDSAYLRGQMTAHQKTAALMQQEISTGKDAALVAFAKTTLPTVEAHLAMDKSDLASMGSMKSAM